MALTVLLLTLLPISVGDRPTSLSCIQKPGMVLVGCLEEVVAHGDVNCAVPIDCSLPCKGQCPLELRKLIMT